jgi:hypothetical protein
MANKKFIHIYLDPKPGITREMIEKKIDLAIDWIRYTDTTWIVYTTSDIEKWQVRLKEFVIPEGSLFICELNINNRNGWMIKSFWEWVQKKRD